ncbi:MAG: ferrous iron transport protein A [Lachnospiraceae bacterium]|nr:ferrous iron transport protein A [Lachnospiraceae bacterium]
MMPLMLASPGETCTIRRVGGSEQLRLHIEEMGFVPGSEVTVVNSMGGNLIVNVKNTRIALSREMAGKIFI